MGHSARPSPLYWQNKRVCVTGGSGFLGYHLVQQLLALGAKVRSLSLEPARRHPLLEQPRVERIYGDVRDAAAVAAAVADCDVVLHTAGTVAMWGPALARMHSIHVDGTRQILAQAPAHARIVHTSSLLAIGTVGDRHPVNEECDFDVDHLRLAYVAAKRASEEVASAAAASGRDVVITNPGFLVGPDDVERSVMGRVCARFWKGRLPVAPPGGINLVDVRDVARGHLLAAEYGKAGRRYLLCGEDRTFCAFFAELAEAAGLRPRAIMRCPGWALHGLAGLAELRGTLVKKEPYPSFQHARLNQIHWYGSSARAIAELGYRARPLSESLADTYHWHAGQTNLSLKAARRWWMRPEAPHKRAA